MRWFLNWLQRILGGVPATPAAPLPTPAPAPEPQPPVVPPAPTPPIGLPEDYAAQLLAIHNAARTSLGLAPLRMSAVLGNMARTYAKTLASYAVLSHDDGAPFATRIAQSGYSYSAAGENVAEGYATAAAVCNGWMSSPEHRRNILDGQFTEVGFGLAYDGRGTPFWCADFGRPPQAAVLADRRGGCGCRGGQCGSQPPQAYGTSPLGLRRPPRLVERDLPSRK
jgi:uncharacterized protein YkwD